MTERLMRAAIIQNGVFIASSNKKIAEAINCLAGATEEVANAVKKSGYQIACSIFESAQLVTKGLSQISDEMERKRKTDEYYFLQDSIDALEDKILNVGGNLEEVYNRTNINQAQQIINLTIPQIRMLFHIFQEKEQQDWLKMTIVFEKSDPIEILSELLESASFTFEIGRKCTELRAHPRKKIFEEGLFFDRYTECYKGLQGDIFGNISSTSDLKLFYYLNLYQRDNHKSMPIPVYEGSSFWERQKSVDELKVHFYDLRDCTMSIEFNNKIKILSEILKHYISLNEDFLPIEEMNKIAEFQNFIFKINSDIVLENYRLLYSELLKAYKQSKLKK